MIEKRLRKLGIFGIISLLSYTAMVLFSPLAYPGYDWLSMAVSDLCAEGAPSEALAGQLNALFGPCGLISIMAVCVSVAACKSKALKAGVYFFTAMEWICNVGYDLFPWVSDAPASNLQNVMHLVVTVLVVLFSMASLVLIAVGAKTEHLKSLSIWAVVCLAAMIIGPIGTALLPKAVFGLFERFSTFSAVVFNAILGIYLMKGSLQEGSLIPKPERLSNGYRVFTDLHVEQFRLARAALQVEVLQNELRKQAVDIIKVSASGDYGKAMELTRRYIAQIDVEKANAEEAIQITHNILSGIGRKNVGMQRIYRRLFLLF